MLLKLFKPRVRSDGLLAVCPDHGGVATALVMRENGLQPTLASCEHSPYDATTTRDALLPRLARQSAFESVPCTSIVDPLDYTLLLIESPQVPAAELRAATRWRVKDLIDFHIDDAVIDVFEVPADKGGRQTMMYAVVTRTNVIKDRADELLDAGFQLSCIDIPELAYRNLTALLPEDVGGVAFIHFAADYGLITLTRQATLYLSRQFNPGFDDLFGGRDEVSADIEGKLDAIIVEIQRSLDYYESHFGQPPISGLVLAPLPHAVSGLKEYFSSQLGIDTRLLDINDLIDCDRQLDTNTQARCMTAIGAALRHEEAAL